MGVTRMSSRLLGVAAIVVAAILWGTTGTVQALMPAGRDPLAVGALRLVFGAVSLLFLAALQPGCRQALRFLPRLPVLFAGIAIGGYNLLFFWAITQAGIGIGTAVAIGSAPVWATAVEVAISRKWPGGLRLMGQGLSIAGVGLLGQAGGEVDGSLTGVLLALLAGGCYAAYSLTTSRIGHLAPSTAIAAATFSVAAIVTLPVLAFAPLGWLGDPVSWLGLVFLGVGATGLSYALYTWSLTRVAASTAVTLALTEPVVAWLLAGVVVGESVTVQSVFGTGLVLAGLFIVTAFPGLRGKSGSAGAQAGADPFGKEVDEYADPVKP